jgi:hypothetical protein
MRHQPTKAGPQKRVAGRVRNYERFLTFFDRQEAARHDKPKISFTNYKLRKWDEGDLD